MLKGEQDADFADMLREDMLAIEKKLESLGAKLQNLLVPPDPTDSRNTIIELRAGTGGDEAALFVGDCVRMYKLYADQMGWRYELLSCAPSELGGFKEYVMVLSGSNLYRFLRYEGGTHRVQRVPETEAQGRVHTSAITGSFSSIFLEDLNQLPRTKKSKPFQLTNAPSASAAGRMQLPFQLIFLLNAKFSI